MAPKNKKTKLRSREPSIIDELNIDFGLMLIKLMDSHDTAQVHEYLDADESLGQYYDDLIRYLNSKAKHYIDSSHVERIQILYFSNLLHQHLTQKKRQETINTMLIAGGSISLLALYVLGVFHKFLLSPEIVTVAQSLMLDPITISIGCLAYVTMELFILFLDIAAVKNPFALTSPIIIPRDKTREWYDHAFDAARLLLRLGAYAMMLCINLYPIYSTYLIAGVSIALAPVSMGLLVLGEAIGILRHGFTMAVDYMATRKAVKTNSDELFEIELRLGAYLSPEDRQQNLYRKYKLTNANAILLSDIKLKQKQFLINTSHAVCVVLITAGMLFIPGMLPFAGATAVVYGIAIAAFILARIIVSKQLKFVEKQQDTQLNQAIQESQEEYQADITKLYLSEKKAPPKRQELYLGDDRTEDDHTQKFLKELHTRIYERKTRLGSKTETGAPPQPNPLSIPGEKQPRSRQSHALSSSGFFNPKAQDSALPLPPPASIKTLSMQWLAEQKANTQGSLQSSQSLYRKGTP